MVLSSRASKDLSKLPVWIVNKFFTWLKMVEKDGLEKVRTRPGFHDEPLRGNLRGYRSVRLNRSYRVIYFILNDQVTRVVCVKEVTNHEY